MSKSIGKKDVEQLKNLSDYFSENETGIPDIVEDISKIVGRKVSEEEIRQAISIVDGSETFEEVEEVARGILEFLYDRNYVERPEHLDEYHEDNSEFNVSSETYRSTNPTPPTEPEKKSNICASILLGLVIFGAYAFYMDYRADKQQTEVSEKRESEIKDLRLEVLSLKESLEQLKRESVSISEKNTRLREELIGRTVKKAEKEAPDIQVPHSLLEGSSPKPTPPTDAKMDMSATKAMARRLGQIENTGKALRTELKETLYAIKNIEIAGVEKDERKILLDSTHNIYKNEKKFIDKDKKYEVDQDLKGEFLKNCLEHYEFRKVDYRGYCLCLADKAVENKVDFLDMNGLLLKHKLSGSYPNFSYMGKDRIEDVNFLEYQVGERVEVCYKEFIVKNAIESFKLNY